VLGTPNKATGDTVKIGYVYDGQSVAIDNTEDMLAAQATVKYVNDYMGGIAGHPIELVVCDGKQDSAISTDCSNQLVQKGVPVVLFTVSGHAGDFIKPLAAANIPVFAFATADAAMIADKTGFTLSNPISAFTFPVAVAAKAKFTKAAMLVTDVPGATGPAKAIGIPAFQSIGATLDIANIGTSVADFGPPVQAALKKDPQLVHMIGNATFCTAAIKALRDADYKGVITGISNCFDATSAKNLGDKMSGIKVSYAVSEDPTNKDYQTYLAILKKYADGQKINLTGTPVQSYANMIGFARVMAKATLPLTPANVVATIQGAGPLPMPTIDGATFSCDGKAVPGIPVACTAAFAIGTLDATGKPVFGS
jgi:branched-chain amino acid transport system substrate-binding protein